MKGRQSEWPRDSSEAGQKQCLKWHQSWLERPHEEKVDEFQALGPVAQKDKSDDPKAQTGKQLPKQLS